MDAQHIGLATDLAVLDIILAAAGRLVDHSYIPLAAPGTNVTARHRVILRRVILKRAILENLLRLVDMAPYN